MKSNLVRTIVVFVGLIMTNAVPAGIPRPFRMDMNHSNIGFAVPIAGGLSKVRGKFGEFKSEFNYDDKDLSKSSIKVIIAAKSIDTGIAQRDDHLRTADFFDVGKFPEIVFVSKRVYRKRGRWWLVGDLTMHGTTRELSFPFSVTGRQFQKEEKLLTVGFFAELIIDRTDFGISYQHESVPEFIGNKIEIELSLITRANPAE